ncbi:MAG: nickel-dependent lactate racemase [Candidatus Zipacnadales bacterium]
MNLTLAYGRGGLPVSLPDRNVRHVLGSQPLPEIENPHQALRTALSQPRGCSPLRKLAAGKRNACIVTSDITRPVPNALLIPPLLEELSTAGLALERVTILIGTGSHRPNTPAELREMLGEATLASGVQVVNHNAFAMEGLLLRGVTSRKTPVYVNRTYAESALKISLALVEPHLIAGFSGGPKAICPGICGIETLLQFHGPDFVQHQNSSLGLLDGNPSHEECLAAALIAGAPELTVNVTLNEQRQLTGLFVGELEAAHRAAVVHFLAQSKAAIPEPVDIVLTTSGGYPLDLTFYQGVKGIAAAVPILKPGGTIIVAHECMEGVGEEDLKRCLRETPDLAGYVPRMFDPAYFHMDQWHAQFTKILRCASEVLQYSTGIPREEQEQCFVTPIESVEEGVERALHKHGRHASIAVLPTGPYVLACVKGSKIDRQVFT